VAKILVADDNSNIQKMVGLALKDHGIDVVAVGNGEAAVRKIADVRPDLILADVFMPVRNGYEVCKYVKEDSALSHIPVILLVGAFDPLDEQEAQRVGADGVLKKPFVPPDPLISMVKSALVRAGVPHAGFAPASEQPPAETAPEAPARVPAVMPLPKPELPIEEAESFVEEVPARPAALKIETGSQPLAFGNLLGNASPEPEADLGNIPTLHPELAQERDWRALQPEEEEEEETAEAKSSWRRDVGDESLPDEAAPATSDWRSQGPSARSSGRERWTPTREREDLLDAAEASEKVTAVATEMKSAPPSAPFASDAWAAAIGTTSNQETAVAEAEKETVAPEAAATPELTAERRPAEPEGTAEPSPTADTITPPTVEPEPSNAATSWFSTAPSPWDAEALKASQLASAWEAAAPVVAQETSAHAESSTIPTPFNASLAAEEIELVSEHTASAISEVAIETAREEVASAEGHDAQGTSVSDHIREEVSEKTADVDIDAVVAKVLARMKPDVLQEVTREILKPVVEAIVREELSSKKL
jgi:CheY-like chemotaxis protein